MVNTAAERLRAALRSMSAPHVVYVGSEDAATRDVIEFLRCEFSFDHVPWSTVADQER